MPVPTGSNSSAAAFPDDIANPAPTTSDHAIIVALTFFEIIEPPKLD
jgi:hypothetical protein